jgi:hypothetical protein
MVLTIKLQPASQLDDWLALWNIVFRKLLFPQLAKKFPTFYENRGLLQRSQEPTTGSYPEPDLKFINHTKKGPRLTV